MTPEGVHFFPVRHHSPVCAMALRAAFDELKPKQVLIEAPVDFERLIPALTDPALRPPVAIVSLPTEKSAEGDRYTATYPFCVHSPEYVALVWGRNNGAEVHFIDLPARHPEMRRHRGQDEQAPAPLIADFRLDHNTYVRELCARRGMPDALALWDALFESQAGKADWRMLFESVGLYCRHTREATDAADMKNDGTLAREAHMAMSLAKARKAGPFPIAVVTGGFHTPALSEANEGTAKLGTYPDNAFLIRYGFRQLDRFSGYGAGLPHPAFYDRFWTALSGGVADQLVPQVITDFADVLRRDKPQLAIPTPSLAGALIAAENLADLRDLPRPGRNELIDALRSIGVKEAIEAGRTPLLEALDDFLTGDAIGELPPNAPQPPIVESVRRQARALAFNLDDAARRTRELDVLRKPRHSAASRFLFALDLISAGFANRVSGPDPITGWRGEMLFETWTYAWSPMVESRLIALAGDGGTLEELCIAELDRRRAALERDGRGRNASAAAEMLVAAVRTGLERAIERTVLWCGEAIGEDSEAESIIAALGVTAGMARPGPGAPAVAALLSELRARAFNRLVLLFPDIAGTAEERLPGLVAAVRELAAMTTGGDDAIDRERLSAAVLDAIKGTLPPVLDGALTVFAGLVGAMTNADVVAHIAAMLDGAYVESGKASAVLTGCLTVSPALLVHNTPLLESVDAFLERVDQDAFLATLPQLRLAFGYLTPGEIDRVAAWVSIKHGLELADVLDGKILAHEVIANETLWTRLESQWREDGLGAWLEPPS